MLVESGNPVYGGGWNKGEGGKRGEMKRGRWWSSLYKSMNISNHAFKGVEAGPGIRSLFFGAKSLVFCD